MGSDLIQNLAEKTGLSQEDISSKLAEYLPGVVDKFTTDGTIPEGGLLEKGLEFFQGKFS
ncbi:YidB family protein [Pelotalea chapellei]|uniref:YidB family protein n=1 Tax=Pelotalea chapellei TaxID=44671 RepID=UPI001FEAB1E2|nr:YidB family protein [Pelotalea chapellei]